MLPHAVSSVYNFYPKSSLNYVYIFKVYVFIGEHIAMVDFVRCLQNRKLLENGEYIVISVDDEIYNANRRVNIMERSE